MNLKHVWLLQVGLILLMHSILATWLPAQDIYAGDEIGKQLTFYYRDPDPAILPKLITSIEANDKARESTPPAPIVGFFTALLSGHLENEAEILRTIDHLTVTKSIFHYSVYLSAHKDTLLHWPEHNADVNDMLWGAYFATADPRYIDKLVSELQFCVREDSLRLFMTGTSAKWSLCSNARQHESVRQLLQARLKNSSPKMKRHLEEILTLEPKTIKQQTVERLKQLKGSIK